MSIKMRLHPQQLLLCLLYYHTFKRAVPTSTPSPCTNINLERLPEIQGVLQVQVREESSARSSTTY